MKCEVAVTGVPAPAPGVDRQPQSTSDAPRQVLSSWAPLLFPAYQLSSDCQFFAKGVFALACNVEILQPQVQRIHVEPGSEVVERAHRNNGGLRMAGRAPGASWAGVGSDGDVFCALVRNVENVRDGR